MHEFLQQNNSDSQQQKIIALQADFRPSGRDTWQLGAGYNQSRRGFGSVDDDIDQPHTAHFNSTFGQVRWQRVLAADREFSVQLYHNAYDSENRTTSLPIAALGGLTFDTGGKFDLHTNPL